MRAVRLHVAFALCIYAATGCNLLLDNDKRSLGSITDPTMTTDTGVPQTPPTTPEDAATDPAPDSGPVGGSPAIDGGPPMSVDHPKPDGGPKPIGCASPDQLAECTPGMPQMEMQKCGLCMRGTQTRTRMCGDTCGWGPYSAWTPCEEDQAACKPDTVQDRMDQACGPCNTGRLISHRTCTDKCEWSEYSEPQCQLDPLYCVPGMTQMLPDMPCGQRCGVIKQTQTCNNMCKWNTPVKSMCMEAGVCTPGATQAASDAACNPDYCMKGKQPQIQVCSSTCKWNAPMANGMCSIPPGICRPLDLGSTSGGYRCDPDMSGYRQVCYMSTASTAQRCTWGPSERFPSCQ